MRPIGVATAMLAVLVLTACASPTRAPPPSPASLAAEPARDVTVVHGALGCLFEIAIHDVAETDGRRVAADAIAEIDRVEDALGGWRDDTDLARLNREAAAGPVATPPLLLDAVARAIELSRATGGAFDVTVGPLVDAYGFRRGAPRLPPRDEIERLRACVGVDRLRLEAGARTIAFDRPGVAVDLDGLNKGIAVDRVIARLREAGVTDASISAGGSTIGSIGPPQPRPPRRIAIAGPDGEVRARLSLRDAVLSTSGAWRRTIELDGREYGPIFDPRSGEPVENGVVSATAIAPRGDESEAFAKAAVVLGGAGAERLASERLDVGFVLLLRGAVGDAIAVARYGEAAQDGDDEAQARPGDP